MINVNRSGNELKLTKKVGHSDPFKSKATHQEIVKSIIDRGYDCASVLISRDRLDDKVAHESKHCKVTRTIHQSYFEDVVRQEAERHYPCLDKVLALMKEKFPEKGTNQEPINSDANKLFKNRLERRVWKAFDFMYFAKIFWDMRLAVESDLKEENPEITRDDLTRKIWEEMFEMMLPQVLTKYDQIFPLQEPFSFWDDRNDWQQWFLVDKGDRIDYACGGSSSSFLREQHGKYGHTFSALSQKGYEIPTHIFHVDRYNQVKFVRSYDCFKVVRNELVGNYRVDWDKTKRLFSNRLLSVSKGVVAEVRA